MWYAMACIIIMSIIHFLFKNLLKRDTFEMERKNRFHKIQIIFGIACTYVGFSLTPISIYLMKINYSDAEKIFGLLLLFASFGMVTVVLENEYIQELIMITKILFPFLTKSIYRIIVLVTLHLIHIATIMFLIFCCIRGHNKISVNI